MAISEKAEKIIHDIPGRYYTIELDWKEVLAPITDYISTLEAENARLKDAQRWIPVSERLPEGDAVLVYRERGKSNIDIDWTFIEGGREYWYNSGLDNVTHWIPLPEPPIMYGKECEE